MLDMTLVFKADGPWQGFWYRAGLEAQDLTTVRTAFVDDEYGLMKVPVTENEIIVDIGACIGAFSALVRKRNPSARIVAVEALTDNIPCLRANVASYATVIPCACTYESKVGILSSLIDGTHASGGSIVQPLDEMDPPGTHALYKTRLEPLRTITLDEIMDWCGLPKINVLKIDAEGSEYSIFEHAQCLSKIDLIVGEYHGGRSRFVDMIDRVFPSEKWKRSLWNPTGHMGLFSLARLQ